jgi:hypothetical protein
MTKSSGESGARSRLDVGAVVRSLIEVGTATGAEREEDSEAYPDEEETRSSFLLDSSTGSAIL